MGETITQEELDDMALQAEWARTHAAVQARVAPPEPTHSVDVNSLPDADKGGSSFTDSSAPEARKPIPPPEPFMQRANRFAKEHPILTGRPLDALRSTPTEDTEDPALLARRNAGKTEEQAKEKETDATPDVAKPDSPNHGDSGGGYGGGGGGVLIPGGMVPDHQERDVKHGKVVGPGIRAALDEAGRLERAGAGIERDANHQLFQQEHAVAMAKVHANETAAAAQQRLAEDRDRIVSTRLAEIETLNKKAQGNPEDIWSAPHVFARMAGFLALALGTYVVAKGGKGAVAGIPIAMSGQFIQGLVNQDIQAKIDERRQAGHAAGRQINLLHLHEERMGSQSKAIEATKLAYYDNILQQMEAYKADHAGQVNEANYNGMQAQILKKQAEAANTLNKQEQADVTDKLVLKHRDPRIIGDGAGAGPERTDKPNIVRLSDGTAWSLGESENAKKARDQILALQRVVDVNKRIKALRRQAYALSSVPGGEDHDEYKSVVAQLETLASQKGPLMSKALDGSVLRDEERKEFVKHDALATGGIGLGTRTVHAILGAEKSLKSDNEANDAAIDQQQAVANEAIRAQVKVDGRRVEQGYVTNEHGQKRAVAEYTGQDTLPDDEGLPRHGFKDDSGKKRITAPPGLDSDTPVAKSFGRDRPTGLPAPASHHGKKKKKK